VIQHPVAESVPGLDERSPRLRPDDSVRRYPARCLEFENGRAGAFLEYSFGIIDAVEPESGQTFLNIAYGRTAVT
jgi:hypothetical protein